MTMGMMTTRMLVLGGARSGKSRYAETTARDRAGTGGLCYIATAEPGDEEMRARILEHQARRGPEWSLIEAPIAVAPAIREAQAQGRLALVDCLTLWLSNLMMNESDVDAATAELVDAVATTTGGLLLVSNEIGLGLAPMTPLGRRFRDAQGRLNQTIAAACDTVVFVAAGLPVALKGEAPG